MSARRADLLAALPDIVAAQVKEALPELRECRGMVGGFDVDELKRRGLSAPAVLVSRLGLRHDGAKSGPHYLWRVEMAAFVVTRNAKGLARDRAAANIVSVLLQLIPDRNWAEAGVGPAEAVEERPLVNRQSREITAALTAVTWEQPIVLSTSEEAAPLAPELYVGWAPEIGAAHEADYETIGEES